MAERKIGKDTFRVAKMGARASQRLLLRIGKLLGPGIETFATAVASTDRERSAIQAIGGMLAKASPEEADALLVDLCSEAQINVQGTSAGQYEPVVFDHHLDHDLIQAWQVAGFVLEVNFRDFFGALAGTGLGQQIRQSVQGSPKQSSGE